MLEEVSLQEKKKKIIKNVILVNVHTYSIHVITFNVFITLMLQIELIMITSYTADRFVNLTEENINLAEN